MFDPPNLISRRLLAQPLLSLLLHPLGGRVWSSRLLPHFFACRFWGGSRCFCWAEGKPPMTHINSLVPWSTRTRSETGCQGKLPKAYMLVWILLANLGPRFGVGKKGTTKMHPRWPVASNERWVGAPQVAGKQGLSA